MSAIPFPEPSTLILMIAGILGLVTAAWRRTRRP